MKPTFRQVINEARSTALGDEEKAQLRRALKSQIHDAGQPLDSGLRRFRFSYLRIFSFKYQSFLVALVLIILVGSGASYAAEGALPGDLLYPIKINFNERVRSIAALSPESKAALSVSLISERLEEAEILATEDKLTPALADQVSSNFEQYARDAEQDINKLKDSNATTSDLAAADESSKLEASLKAHRSLLTKLQGEGESDMGVLRVNDTVESKIKGVSENRISVDDREFTIASSTLGLKNAAENKQQVAEKKLEKMSDLSDQKIMALSQDIRDDATAKLQAAKNQFAEGVVDLEAGNYEEAFSKFQDSMRTAQEAKVIIDVGGSIKFHDKESVVEDENNSATSTEATSTPAKINNRGKGRDRQERQSVPHKVDLRQEDQEQSETSGS